MRLDASDLYVEVERGRRNPPLAHLTRIADADRCSSASLSTASQSLGRRANAQLRPNPAP
jgi:hypothetical protein